jgi:hypothetical protein
VQADVSRGGYADQLDTPRGPGRAGVKMEDGGETADGILHMDLCATRARRGLGNRRGPPEVVGL